MAEVAGSFTPPEGIEAPLKQTSPPVVAMREDFERPTTNDALSVVVPAFNEETAIGPVLDRLLAVLGKLDVTYEIIVVDDGSDDATGACARQRDRVRVIRHPQNAGYGASVYDGVLAARHECIIITDADGTYPIEALPELLRWARDFDMVVGARTGRAYRGSLFKFPARLVFGALCSFVTGTGIPDVNSGLRVMRRDLVLAFSDPLSRGMSFTTTMTLALLSNGYFVKFIPISYHERIGHSKVRYVRDTLRTSQILVQAITRYNPIKLFLVLAALSTLSGFTAIGVGWVLGIAVLWTIGALQLAAVLPLFGLGLVADLLRSRQGSTLPPNAAQRGLAHPSTADDNA